MQASTLREAGAALIVRVTCPIIHRSELVVLELLVQVRVFIVIGS